MTLSLRPDTHAGMSRAAYATAIAMNSSGPSTAIPLPMLRGRRAAHWAMGLV